MKPRYRFYEWRVCVDPNTFEPKWFRSYYGGEMGTLFGFPTPVYKRIGGYLDARPQ